MAVQFHPLPPELFSEKARPHIARFNRELSDLFALEGTLRNPATAQRSDQSIVRQSGAQVDQTRITPTIAVSGGTGGAATIGTPALSFGTANAVGSTTTVVSINSSIALFGTGLPAGVSTASLVGTSAYAARADHVHGLSLTTILPTTTKGDLIVHDGSANVRFGVGADDYVLTGSAADTDGVTWAVPRHRLLATFLSVATISNTNVPTTFTAEGVTISAGSFAAGRHARWTFHGTIGSTGVATNLTVDLIAGTGPTTVVSTGTHLFTPNLTLREWEMRVDVTCKAAGSPGNLEAQGWFRYATSTTAMTTWEMLNTAVVSYDTAADQMWAARVTWGTTDTANIIALRQRIVEMMEAP